tara:strand:+ start:134 stop:496 length:363 start_codon:yes stop_codon:yes gene_type:complete
LISGFLPGLGFYPLIEIFAQGLVDLAGLLELRLYPVHVADRDGKKKLHEEVGREIGVPGDRGLVEDAPGLVVIEAEHDLELAVKIKGVLKRGFAGGLSVDVDRGTGRLRFNLQDALNTSC